MPAFPKPTATETDPVATPVASSAAAAASAAQATADAAASAASAAQSTANGAASTAAGAVALAGTKALPTKAWVTGTAYLQGQMVTNGGHTYTANDAHTSGATFAGDLAGHWTLLPVTASDVGAIATSALDTDSTFAANSDTKVPSQKAVKTAIAAVDTSTLIPKSIGTAKGDTIAFTGSGVPARKAVGADGRLLRANSAISDGTEWGGPVNQAPADKGLIAWAFDISLSYLLDSALTLGFPYFVRVPIPQTMTLTNLVTYISGVGSSLTTGQTLGGVYSSAGVLLGKTATQHTAWQSTGLKTMGLTAESGQSLTVTPGYVFAAFLANGSAAPNIPYVASGFLLPNVGQASPTASMQVGSSGQTALPSSMGSPTVATTFRWAAFS